MSTCSANIDGWCETHSTGEGPSWCVDALKVALRRARFHERENYERWRRAENVLDSVRVLAQENRGSKSKAKRRFISALSDLTTPPTDAAEAAGDEDR